jgi:dTDP-4-amino-4,6-dideoxygalactose transaminase
MNKVVFNNPFFFNNTKKNINKVLSQKIKETTGGKTFFKKSCNFLEKKLKARKAIITNSCTASLEIAALLIDVKPGDEIIMPSYTFVSTANAFVLRGGKPVFVDIRKDNLNIDEKLIEKSITKKTKAIVVVHYAGVPCNMDKIVKIGKKYNLFVIEDAAQAIFSKYKNKYCGTIGDIGCFSFHETKNITSCEGGAIILNKKIFDRKASIICNKGTDREYFNKSLKKYYSWKGLGSSYIPSEITCSILYSQLINYKKIMKERKKIWIKYYSTFKNFKSELFENKTYLAKDIDTNYHMFFLICRNFNIRTKILTELKKIGVFSAFHYIPLHKSKFGSKYFRKKLTVTEELSKKIIRLPLWIGVNQNFILKKIKKILND